MALQSAVSVRNAQLAAFETDVGTDPVLRIRAGAPPADCAAADSGAVLSTIVLPTDWLTIGAPSGGQASKSGTWQDLTADGTGTAAHFRLYASDGVTCKLQGTVTLTAGGGDMTVDNVSFQAGQGSITVTSWVLTMGGA